MKQAEKNLRSSAIIDGEETQTFTAMGGRMTVTIPKALSPAALQKAWIKGFIEYMTQNCLVSNSVLFSSIGASRAKSELIEGIKQHFSGSEQERFLNACAMDQMEWEYQIVSELNGWEAALIHKYGKDADKMIEIMNQMINKDS